MLVNETWVLALLLRDLFSAWRDLEWGGKDVATAGEKMPQKSTYFYPKLITGLVMNKF